jgi:hypothetical protein
MRRCDGSDVPHADPLMVQAGRRRIHAVLLPSTAAHGFWFHKADEVVVAWITGSIPREKRVQP